MPKHRGGVLTPYGAATPLSPPGFACASLGGLAAGPVESPGAVATRLEAPPRIWPRGARKGAAPLRGRAPRRTKREPGGGNLPGALLLGGLAPRAAPVRLGFPLPHREGDEAYSSSMNEYRYWVGGAKFSFTLRADTQRRRFILEPALSLVPLARPPPKGCCPTTAPVGLSLM